MSRAYPRYPTLHAAWMVGLALAAWPGLAFGQDETLDILDGETLYEGGWLWTLSAEIERREELLDGEREVDDPFHRRQTDSSITLAGHYGLLYNLQLSAILPYVHRELESSDPAAPDRLAADGIGDLVTLAKWRFYRWDAPGEALNVSAIGGLEWPTGSDDERDRGIELDPELQPGSGSFDPLGGLALTYEPRRWRFNAFGLYKVNTESRDDHEFGDELFAELAVGNRFWLEPYPGPFMRADLLLRYRNEQRAYRDGVVVGDSGRDLLTTGLNLAFRPRPSLDFQAQVEVPFYQRVDGQQLGNELSVQLSFGYRF